MADGVGVVPEHGGEQSQDQTESTSQESKEIDAGCLADSRVDYPHTDGGL